MAKIENFDIILNKNEKNYFTGDIIAGEVVIRTDSKYKFDTITVQIVGEGHVKWIEKETRNATEHTNSVRLSVDYESKETYLSHRIKFIVNKETDGNVLEAGLNKYPFEFTLPNDLPNSFQHKFGRIQYFIRGHISLPSSIEKQTEKAFSVINQHDLNFIALSKQAIGASGQETVCCGPCRSDPICASIYIKKSGYVAGEYINFTAKIDNRTSQEIKFLCVRLIQQTRFHGNRKPLKNDSSQQNFTKTKSRVDNRLVKKLYYRDKIAEYEIKEWNGSLVVPSVCGTSNHNTSIGRLIDISYQLTLSYDLNQVSMSSDLVVPIIIGTIPLNESKQDEIQSIPSFTLEPCIYGDEKIEIESEYETTEINNETFVKSLNPVYNFKY